MALRPVTGRVLLPDDSGLAGTVGAVLSASSLISGAAPQPLIRAARVVTALQGDGSFTFAGLEPNSGLALAGTVYAVTINQGLYTYSFTMAVPAGAGAIDVSTPGVIVQMPSVPLPPQLSVAALIGMDPGDMIVGGAPGNKVAKGADSKVWTMDPITHLPLWAAAAAGGGGSTPNDNESAASVLIGATPAGVSGAGLSDHFLGTVLRDVWTLNSGYVQQPLTAKYSCATFQMNLRNGRGDYWKPFTPSGNFEVHFRVFPYGGRTYGGGTGVFIMDNNANPDTVITGTGVVSTINDSGVWSADQQDSGVVTSMGSLPAANSLPDGWTYVSISRTGNYWTIKVSPDRVTWFLRQSNFSKIFTVGKIGFRAMGVYQGQSDILSCDFIDVVS